MVVDAAHRHHALDVLERQALGLEVGFVGRQQRDQMAAGGMAAQEQLVGPAAVVGDVLVRPGEGGGHVLDVFGVLDVRRQAVADDGSPDAVAGEHLAHALVDAEKVAVAEHPAPPWTNTTTGKSFLPFGK